jgi:hypothetical protein
MATASPPVPPQVVIGMNNLLADELLYMGQLNKKTCL